jgi:hypothetical protein
MQWRFAAEPCQILGEEYSQKGWNSSLAQAWNWVIGEQKIVTNTE